MSIRVVSYNVLSPELCDATIFPRCAPEALNNGRRLGLLRAKLGEEMEQKSIILLQEVPLQWYGDLFAHFNSLGYTFISCHYGAEATGYMGVGVAYPVGPFELVTCSVGRVGDRKKWGLDQSDVETMTFASWYEWVTQAITSTAPGLAKLSHTPWIDHTDIQIARQKRNQIVMLRLVDARTNRCFIVATYHMPCEFRRPNVMTLHVGMMMDVLGTFARGDPLILGGDFNALPQSPVYMAIADGPLGLESAYFRSNRKEPAFTTHCYSSHNGAFTGTLDYIWVSADFDVRWLRSLPDIATQHLLPTTREPSDHLMIGAVLALRHKSHG